MNREIKFRAWDKQNKIMRTPIRCWDFAHGIIETHKLDEPESDKDLDEVELMQFTGIKDCDGKEIYEGDVVEVIALRSDHNPREQLGNYEVYWGKYTDCEYVYEAEGWLFNKDNPNFLSDAHNKTYGHPAYEIEVIGNIYENPELIQETK